MVNSEKIVEIGPVFLAKNGVCYLGDWSGLSKKVSDEIKISELMKFFVSFENINETGICSNRFWAILSERNVGEFSTRFRIVDVLEFNEFQERFLQSGCIHEVDDFFVTILTLQFQVSIFFCRYFGIPIMTDWNESDDIIEFLLVEARDGKIDVSS